VRFHLSFKALSVATVFYLPFGGLAFGQTATSVTGLYNTGLNSSGGAQTQGQTDANWTVTYAEVGGASASQYTGSAYVVVGALSAQHTANSTTPPAQWITAPGAKAGVSGAVNTGGSYLPGNGTSGANSAAYVYRLAITITGSGAAGTVVTNNVAIALTIAGDDQYAVYVNPTASPTVDINGVISAGTTAASSVNTGAAYKNKTALSLQNFGAGAANNATFVIGQNYLYVVVANTNGISGSSNSSTINQAGLLVYQASSQFTTIGPAVPEVGTWLPVVLALGLFVRRRFIRHTTAAV